MNRILPAFLVAALLGLPAPAAPPPAPAVFQETAEAKAARMQWFADAKLGIFIHWGIYAVHGIDESWSFYNGHLGYEDYMKQLDGFTAAQYDPAAWAALIQESGAKYAVLTTKHHDGVALWNTQLSDLSTVKRTPARRDLVAPFSAALRQKGLKLGLYYSHLDWSHPDYPHHTKVEKRYTEDAVRWERFLAFQQGQVQELCTRFKPDLLWFDGDWDYSAEQWRAAELRAKIAQWAPGSIVNARINGHGDYDTPENGVPIYPPKARWWELCMTINDSWGYQEHDHAYKSPNQIIRIFADCVGMGGNLLLDIGPKADGTIPEAQVAVLKELGRWTRKHREAIYGSVAGLPKAYFPGPSTLSKDRTMLYLFLEGRPTGPVAIKGLKNKVQSAWVLGHGTKLEPQVRMKAWWSSLPGIIYLDVPPEALDRQVTVLALRLDGPAELHREEK